MAPGNFLDKMNAVKVGPRKAPAVAVEEEAEGEEDTLLGPVTFLFQGVKVVGGFPLEEKQRQRGIGKAKNSLCYMLTYTAVLVGMIVAIASIQVPYIKVC